MQIVHQIHFVNPGLDSPESRDLQAAWLGYISQPHFLPLGLVIITRCTALFSSFPDGWNFQVE